MSILFEDSFKVDYSIYNNLINLLISHKLIDYNCLDRETSLLLAEPLKLINYSFLDNDKQMTAFSSPELYLIINSLLKERIIIVDLFEKMNKERKKLRDDNISLLRQIFFGNNEGFKKKKQILFNRTFLINYELLKYFNEREEITKNKIYKKLDEALKKIESLTQEVAALEKKLVKSRENLKQFLVTGQVSIQTLAALGLDTSLNINPDNNLLLNNMLYTGHLDFSPINTNNLETSPINSYFLKSKQFHDENNSVISNNKRETQSYIGFTQNDYSNTELNIQSPFFNQNLTINKKNEVIQRNLPEKTTNLTIDQQKKSSGNKFINNSTGNLKPYNDITTFKQLLTPEETQKIKINNKPIMPFINSEGLAFNKYIQSARVKTEPSQDQLNNLDNRKINVEPFQLDNSLDLDKTCLPSNQNSGFLHASLSKKIQDRINIPNSNLKIEEFNKNVRSIPSKSVIYESSQLGKMIYNLSSTLKQKNNNQNNRNLFKKK